MPRTSTKYISFETLKTRGPSAITVIKLMMAYNDLSLANQALTEWKKEQPRSKKSRQTGAGMYFVRIELAHLYEGLKVIDAIRSDTLLMTLVRQCSQETQQAFHDLESFCPKGSNHTEFKKLIGRMRHNLTFHYDESGKLIEKAISDSAAYADGHSSSVTIGDTAHLGYFKVADIIVNSIVVRQIWEISKETNLRIEADKIADRVHQIFLWFVNFSEEFIWLYCQS